MHSPAEMKKMANRRVAELLEKLKSDPNNVAVLAEVAAIYHTSHQFKEAAVYYDRAVEVDPKDVAMRTKLASALYYSGDVDGAIAQLNKGLIYDPKDANSLFNLGLIKLQGKQDAKGALAAWRKLLKSNPQLSEDRKATVQQLMATALTMLSDQNGIQGARGNDGHKSDSN
jgi:cytochrome c-type biogenesis protein CcmH/NrfG